MGRAAFWGVVFQAVLAGWVWWSGGGGAQVASHVVLTALSLVYALLADTSARAAVAAREAAAAHLECAAHHARAALAYDAAVAEARDRNNNP